MVDLEALPTLPDDWLTAPAARSILVVEDDPDQRLLLTSVLEACNYEVTVASDGAAALLAIGEAIPDLILADVMMPAMTGTELLRRVRADANTRAVPFILLTTRAELVHVVEGLDLGADDYLTKPFHIPELLARVRGKLERPPVPVDSLPHDVQTGFLTARRLRSPLQREIERARQTGRSGGLAAFELSELERLRTQLGPRQDAEIARQTGLLLRTDAQPLEVVGRDAAGRFLVLLPEASADAIERRLDHVARRVAAHVYRIGDERLRLTPTIGWALFAGDDTVDGVLARAHVALDAAAGQLDLVPIRYQPELEPVAAERRRAAAKERGQAGIWPRLRTPLQIVSTFVLGLVLPYLLYTWAARAGHDITRPVYLVVVAALVMTCLTIWAEGFAARRRIDPPAEPATPYPPASAIIAAYLPNEAATIIETIEAMLRLDYPAPLQIILAYNTPRNLPIEDTLRAIARRDARFIPLRIAGSESKAQNVNSALAAATGELVGIFDADHHPDPDSFRRAWRWISHGADVVQGHCLVRNGDASWVARTIAVEFEQIYAVSHPGRARLHGFGIFGGSNGYWRTALLQKTRMRGFMLTEDIDSSMRVIEDGGVIVSDPYLISRELAPSTLGAFWNQRLRWAQGWFQVSLTHFLRALVSPRLTLRNKLGLFYLLVWREVFPWLSLQVVPIIAFWATRRDGLGAIDWLVPLFVCTTLFTLATGPGQVLFTYYLADPQIRRHRGWFWSYVLRSVLYHSELKNLISRVAQVKQAMGEKSWRVTPRQTPGTPGT